jgi:hypothetical protein
MDDIMEMGEKQLGKAREFFGGGWLFAMWDMSRELVGKVSMKITSHIQFSVREGFIRDVVVQNDGSISQGSRHQLLKHCRIIRYLQLRSGPTDWRNSLAGLSILQAKSTLSSPSS